ncbi:hypothetical protein BDR03DRAFT_524427 [Suillus americanus]|nr:hypothetical protein BDR03DRAFT_524427 [Suillus americanus]
MWRFAVLLQLAAKTMMEVCASLVCPSPRAFDSDNVNLKAFETYDKLCMPDLDWAGLAIAGYHRIDNCEDFRFPRPIALQSHR